jgi:hypothetical protein
MTSIDYETLVYDFKARKEFFANYDKLIRWCKEFGFLEAARNHQHNRKRLWDEVSLLD